jgi:hypothetical protein
MGYVVDQTPSHGSLLEYRVSATSRRGNKDLGTVTVDTDRMSIAMEDVRTKDQKLNRIGLYGILASIWVYTAGQPRGDLKVVDAMNVNNKATDKVVRAYKAKHPGDHHIVSLDSTGAEEDLFHNIMDADLGRSVEKLIEMLDYRKMVTTIELTPGTGGVEDDYSITWYFE